MKTIEKLDPPECLALQTGDWSSIADPDSQNHFCYDCLRAQLHQEQNGLCAYCEVSLVDQGEFIEHMEPRSINPGRTFDYSNLVLSCRLEGHCGRHKDNSSIAFNSLLFATPHDSNTSRLFKYETSGHLSSVTEGNSISNYLIEYLNLDHTSLVNRRRAHAEIVTSTIGEEDNPENIDAIFDFYLTEDNEGKLRSFYSLTATMIGLLD